MDFPHFSKTEGTRRICAAFGLVEKILHFVKSVPDKMVFNAGGKSRANGKANEN